MRKRADCDDDVKDLHADLMPMLWLAGANAMICDGVDIIGAICYGTSPRLKVWNSVYSYS